MMVQVSGATLIEVGSDHRLADPEPLEKMLGACEEGNNMEKLRGLKAGDSVTITFTTDFERHRIKTMRINPASESKSGGSPLSGSPPKK